MDSRVISITSDLLLLQKLGSYPIENLQAGCTKEFHQDSPSTITVGATPCHMMGIRVASND
jgi:hypothetical protein